MKCERCRAPNASATPLTFTDANSSYTWEFCYRCALSFVSLMSAWLLEELNQAPGRPSPPTPPGSNPQTQPPSSSPQSSTDEVATRGTSSSE